MIVYAKTIYPRLTANATVRIKGHIYKVHFWYPSRTYEFTSETTETRIKTEQEVADLLLAKRVEIIDRGLGDPWKIQKTP